MKKEKLRFKAFYAHPISEVWDAITQPEQLKEWLMDGAFNAKPNEEFEWKRARNEKQEDPLENRRCRVQIVEKEKFLSYQILNPEDGSASVVSWTLEEKEAGTEVILEHEHFSEEMMKPHPQVIMQSVPIISLEEYRLKRAFARLMAELEAVLKEVA